MVHLKPNLKLNYLPPIADQTAPLYRFTNYGAI